MSDLTDWLLEQIARKRETFTPTLHGVPTGLNTVQWHDGRPRWLHSCQGELVDAGLDNTRWTWNSAKGTITPSLSCSRCGLHGFWTNGGWRAI